MIPYPNYICNLALSSVTPNSVDLRNNAAFDFFCRYLMQKAISVFKWELPETWDKSYFLYTLYAQGFVIVVPTARYGIIPQHGSVGGLNVFYQPLYALVTNPLLEGEGINGKQLLIEADCSIIKLTPEYYGIMDMITEYAEKLALCEQTMRANLMNSRLAYVFGAEDSRQAATFKKMMQKILTGDPAVFVDKNIIREDGSPAWQLFLNNLRNNYIVDDIIIDAHKIEAEFCTKIGIPNTNTDKRERLTRDEVNANNDETDSLSDLWLDNIRLSTEKVTALYPEIKISVERRYKRNDVDTITGNADNNRTVQL